MSRCAAGKGQWRGSKSDVKVCGRQRQRLTASKSFCPAVAASSALFSTDWACLRPVTKMQVMGYSVRKSKVSKRSSAQPLEASGQL